MVLSLALDSANVARHLFGSHAPHRNVAKGLVDGLHTLPLGLDAARRKVRDSTRKEPLRCTGEGQPEEVVFACGELARLGLSNQYPFLALRFAPVASVQRSGTAHRQRRNVCAKCYRAFLVPLELLRSVLLRGRALACAWTARIPSPSFASSHASI